MAFHVFLARGPIRDYAPTYDEPLHLTSGYVYLKTADYRINGYHHPAFGEMWAALPLLWMNVPIPKDHNAWILKRWDPLSQFRFADTFLYKNTISAERLMEAGRWMQVGLSLILGVLVGFVAWKLGGAWSAFFSLVFWALSPTVLANGTLVSTDMAFATTTFLFFASFLLPPNKMQAFLSGTALGFSLVSKYFAIANLPMLICVAAFQWAKDRKLFWEKAKKYGSLQYLFYFFIGVFLIFVVVYQGFDFSVFSSGIQRIFGRSQMGRASFFMGGHRNEGWLFYFPVLFLLKTPIPLLFAFVAASVFSLRKKIHVPSVLWIPPILFFLLACLSKVQIGHRYILMVYPFLFVVGGLALAQNVAMRWMGGVGVLWLLASAWWVHPHFLPYFNELIGGPAQGYKYFTDSNNDWGQGIKGLSAVLEPSDLENGIYLSYFGVADPHVYGLKYYDVGSDAIAAHSDDSTFRQLKPTKFAISITNLQATYYSHKDVFSWLGEFEPWKRVGHSIFIYDFKNRPDALSRLEQLRTGRG